MNRPRLVYNETSLPGVSLADRFNLASYHNLALEVANCGNFSRELYQLSGLKIVSVQAYRMHDFHPLHPDLEHRKMAVTHVLETLELAARLEAGQIVTVCGFGHNLVENYAAECIDFFIKVSARVKQLGIKIAIEPLSPQRVAAFNPDTVVELIKTLDRPDVFFLLLDTGHLTDSNLDLNRFFTTWKYPILELQLKGLNSTPPKLETIQSWWQSLNNLPEIVCLEHRQPITLAEFESLVAGLNGLLAAATR